MLVEIRLRGLSERQHLGNGGSLRPLGPTNGQGIDLVGKLLPLLPRPLTRLREREGAGTAETHPSRATVELETQQVVRVGLALDLQVQSAYAAGAAIEVAILLASTQQLRHLLDAQRRRRRHGSPPFRPS